MLALTRHALRRPTSNSSCRCFCSSPSSLGLETNEVGDVGASLTSNHNFVDATSAPLDFCRKSAVVYENAVTEEEAEALVQDIENKMKRRRYEKGHWDSVISLYKEVELPLPTESPLSPLSDVSASAISRVRKQLETLHFGPCGTVDQNGHTKDAHGLGWIPCHGIDLKKEGKLTAHVDSVRYSGHIVAGLSLLSSSIMRLRPAAELVANEQKSRDGSVYEPKENEAPGDGLIDLLLPPRSLYVLSGVSRYCYSHELLECGSVFHVNNSNANDEGGGSGSIDDLMISRERRISIILRDTKD